GRGGHLLEVNLECVVELGVAVAEEGAAGRVVTDGPVLVEERALCRHCDGSAPGDALVCRTANHHVHNAASSLVSAQPGDQPDVMTEVEGHRWVTRGEEWTGWRRRRCGRGQKAVCERVAAVVCRRKPDVAGAAIEDAADLEGGHEGGPGSECVRLHLG